MDTAYESLAKLFGILSTGGDRDGSTIISPETLKLGLTPLSEGPDTVILGAPIRFGVGYDLGLGSTTIKARRTLIAFFGIVVLAGRSPLAIPKQVLVTASCATECTNQKISTRPLID